MLAGLSRVGRYSARFYFVRPYFASFVFASFVFIGPFGTPEGLGIDSRIRTYLHSIATHQAVHDFAAKLIFH